MNTTCRGVRGAIIAGENTREAILSASQELLERLVAANSIGQEQVAAVFFTTTQDLNAEFPAVTARQMGWSHVALLCGHEMSVPDDLPRCIRVLLLINTEKSADELVNVYLKGTERLRSRGVGS